MDLEDTRFIKNKFPSGPPTGDTSLTDLKTKVKSILAHDLKDFLKAIAADETTALASDKKENCEDIGVFEGAGSYLTMYIWLLKFAKNVNDLETQNGEQAARSLKEILAAANLTGTDLVKRAETAYNALAHSLKSIERKSKRIRISYYFGGPNIYLSGCLLSYFTDDEKRFVDDLMNLQQYKKIIENGFEGLYMEVLYGVAGYLYCFLELQTQCPKYLANPEIAGSIKKCVFELVELILNTGINAYDESVDLSKLPKDFRLVYNFHGKEYFGGAHGLFGILYILLKAYQLNHADFAKESSPLNDKLQVTVQASLKYLLGFQYQTGSFASSANSRSGGKLVQFCHGSTGAIPCLLLATEVFNASSIAPKCLDAALLSGENVWEEGILKKGYGLCHGITGNAYSLLTLYRYTNDVKWLYRAYCFIITKEEKYYQDEIAAHDFGDRFKPGVSDYPYSVMLGLAGDICMEVDSLFPELARFPGYEV